MRYVSLFSGIEAASVAWGPLGWEPVAFAEIEPFCCRVLEERFPEAPNLGDVSAIDWSGYEGSVDVVVGGSPCQSFSIAGRREGLAGASGLMWEYVRAVREVRPRWLVWENVPGALSSSGGEDFRCLLLELDALGYGLAWDVLDAQFFGLAQRRERLFVVGRLGDIEGPCQVLFEPESLRWDSPSSKDKRKALAAGAGRGPASAGFNANKPPIVAFAANQRGEVRLQGGDGEVCGAIPASQSGKQVQGVTDGYAVRRLTPRECERLQGFPDDWTRVPWRGKPADRCPDTPRYKAIGNSMAVPVMRWIGERIAMVEEAVR